MGRNKKEEASTPVPLPFVILTYVFLIDHDKTNKKLLQFPGRRIKLKELE